MVGTDHHPFNRLVEWMDAWLESRSGAVRCLVQYGSSDPPRVAQGSRFFDHADVEPLMRQARVVVSHGGPTTIAEARRAGHLPLVVARDPLRGEHVDDHQLRFSRRLSTAGLIDLVESRERLVSALESRLRATPSATPAILATDPAVAAMRFGKLVDELLQQPGSTRRRRVARFVRRTEPRQG